MDEKIKELEAKIQKKKETLQMMQDEHVDMWKTYGSELSAGDVEKKEERIEKQIKKMEAELTELKNPSVHLNSVFDRVVTINLVSRPDKREDMERRLFEQAISTRWYTAVEFGFAPAVSQQLVKSATAHLNPDYPNEFGAALSHYSVIKTALQQGVQNLFIFEDDCVFHHDFRVQFSKAWHQLPSDWDAVMLYSFMFKILPQNVRVAPRWIKSFKAWSHIAIGMNRRFMEAYVKMMDQKLMIADHVTYMLQERGGLNVYSVAPTLCIPNAKLGSNIRGQQLNYVQTTTAINIGIDNEKTYK